ncbi:uncharacterized protein LOC122716861 isoform X1 [Apis laboriosa]|uniref:uncharacterized protein LOC122716861 isoform X1 n=1 Tax=Apis laboriosa TaxID=183418 RepID=UPI001CC4E87B|nr:uncharacterized protein LOC122716861 isoform X1 [Apis laboriosa]
MTQNESIMTKIQKVEDTLNESMYKLDMLTKKLKTKLLTMETREELETQLEEIKEINAILGENSIEESFTSCPKGEEGLECRRAEARRSVDCPQGDCYCYNCAAAGPELWASCCRESLRCCSHLAAACRTCDHPTLYPFCSKHFKKCLVELKKQN